MFALLLGWITFRQARLAASRADVNTAAALLRGLGDRFLPDIAASYFSTSYSEEVARERSEQNRGNLEVVFLIAEEPLAQLAQDQRAVANGLVSAETVKLATVALWQVSKINGLIRQQATFNAVHGPDFYDPLLSGERKAAVHQASVTMSKFLHGGIGNAKEEWFEPLERAVSDDLTKLAQKNGWWNYARRNTLELCGDVFVALVVAVVLAAFAHMG